MPIGHRETSPRSSPTYSPSLTLLRSAIVASVMPRRSRACFRCSQYSSRAIAAAASRLARSGTAVKAHRAGGCNSGCADAALSERADMLTGCDDMKGERCDLTSNHADRSAGVEPFLQRLPDLVGTRMPAARGGLHD